MSVASREIFDADWIGIYEERMEALHLEMNSHSIGNAGMNRKEKCSSHLARSLVYRKFNIVSAKGLDKDARKNAHAPVSPGVNISGRETFGGDGIYTRWGFIQ